MALFPWQKKVDDKGEPVLELPDEIVKGLKAGEEAKEGLSRIEKMLKDQADVQAKRDADEKKAREDAAAEAARKAAEQKNGTLEEQIEALMLEGRTKEAINLATSGQSKAIMTINARQVQREVFEDADRFKYYHGDIKREVDAMLEGQTLEFRANPVNVANTYDLVLGKHTPELLEGKLKTRFAGGSSNTNAGNTGGTGDNDDPSGKIDDEIRKMAKQFGMSGEDYAKMLDAEGIGY